MNFKELLLSAKECDMEARGRILLMYKPLLIKESIVDAGVLTAEIPFDRFYVVPASTADNGRNRMGGVLAAVSGAGIGG